MGLGVAGGLNCLGETRRRTGAGGRAGPATGDPEVLVRVVVMQHCAQVCSRMGGGGKDHEPGGGLACDLAAVAEPGSCCLRNGTTREGATRSGSSSITQWPWPLSSSTWADGNAWR